MNVPHPGSRNVFEWRAAFNELATKFVEYADHNDSCKVALHDHDTPIDDRIACDASPCTCGLDVVLSTINPGVTYTMPCPDVPPKPIVFESEQLPEGVIRVGSSLVDLNAPNPTLTPEQVAAIMRPRTPQEMRKLLFPDLFTTKPRIEAARMVNGKWRVRTPDMDSNSVVEMSDAEYQELRARVLETDEMGIDEY